MAKLRADPLQFDPDAEARKRLAETKAQLLGQKPGPPGGGGAQVGVMWSGGATWAPWRSGCGSLDECCPSTPSLPPHPPNALMLQAVSASLRSVSPAGAGGAGAVRVLGIECACMALSARAGQ